MIARRPKRFYSTAELTGSGPFRVALDGRPVKTPLKRDLLLTDRPLAQAIAEEWNRQAEIIDTQHMVLTKLANTAIDRVVGHRERVIDDILQYAGSDLVCYRAAEPEGLVTRQSEFWDPILTWSENSSLGARFRAIQGIVHQPQPEHALSDVRQRLESFEPFRLCAVHNLTTLTGSALIAMAIEAKALEAERAWLAAHVDENWQIERWGKDQEAESRRAERRREFDDTVRFIRLLA